MRRGVGVNAVKKRAKEKQDFEVVGQAAAAENLAHVEALMATFKSSLENFARKHKKDINQDPAFRQQFQTMCTNIGVDPLASKKGFWSEMLGVGDFYYELSVQITEICLATRPTNGGLLALQELLDRLSVKRRRKGAAISADDVKRAIGKLKVLGSGFGLVDAGRTQMVVSVPRELSGDAAAVLQAAEGSGYTSSKALQSSLLWTHDRANRALTSLAQDGMAWVDKQGGGSSTAGDAGADDLYYFPSLWKGDHYLGVDAAADAADEQQA